MIDDREAPIQILVIGLRGVGKSHLIRKIETLFREDSFYKARIIYGSGEVIDLHNDNSERRRCVDIREIDGKLPDLSDVDENSANA